MLPQIKHEQRLTTIVGNDGSLIAMYSRTTFHTLSILISNIQHLRRNQRNIDMTGTATTAYGTLAISSSDIGQRMPDWINCIVVGNLSLDPREHMTISKCSEERVQRDSIALAHSDSNSAICGRNLVSWLLCHVEGKEDVFTAPYWAEERSTLASSQRHMEMSEFQMEQ